MWCGTEVCRYAYACDGVVSVSSPLTRTSLRQNFGRGPADIDTHVRVVDVEQGRATSA